MNDKIDERPTLKFWLEKYDAISEDFMQTFRSQGILFEKKGSGSAKNRQLRASLSDKAVLFRNGGAGVSYGNLSPACASCTRDCGSRTFYISLKCHKNCFFCFNPNQSDYEKYLHVDRDWKEDLGSFGKQCREVTHIALTGGEPLLHKEKTYEFFEYARQKFPEAYMRLYTAGEGLDETVLRELRNRGLSEIRFSIKIEDNEEDIAKTLERIELSTHYISVVMVEMPVFPGTVERMKVLLNTLEKFGIFGINLLELCFPLNNWQEFKKRTFVIKNPPFSVLYNYEYAGSLPIAGSENACLELLEYAYSENMAMGVHYCSLENKHRSQIYQQNSKNTLNLPWYRMNEADFFYETVKVFDQDVDLVLSVFEKEGITDYGVDEEDRCILFHPDYSSCFRGLPVQPVLSKNVIERDAQSLYIRELGLEVITSDSEETLVIADRLYCKRF